MDWFSAEEDESVVGMFLVEKVLEVWRMKRADGSSISLDDAEEIVAGLAVRFGLMEEEEE